MSSRVSWDTLPTEIKERMLEEQFNQKGIKDENVFIKNITEGFLGSKSEEGHSFWKEVLIRGDIYLFFTKYPRQQTIKNNQTMILKSDKKVFKSFTFKGREITLAILASHQPNGNYKLSAGYAVCSPEDLSKSNIELGKVISLGRATSPKSKIDCGEVSEILIENFNILKSILGSIQYKIENGIFVIRGIKQLK